MYSAIRWRCSRHFWNAAIRAQLTRSNAAEDVQIRQRHSPEIREPPFCLNARRRWSIQACRASIHSSDPSDGAPGNPRSTPPSQLSNAGFVIPTDAHSFHSCVEVFTLVLIFCAYVLMGYAAVSEGRVVLIKTKQFVGKRSRYSSSIA